MFAVPTGLPPIKPYDHHIPLLPGSIPVNSRPYRYSPAHKTEFEKQVSELLVARLDSPSRQSICFTSVACAEEGW